MKQSQKSSRGEITDWLTKIAVGLVMVGLPGAFGALVARWPGASTEAWMNFTGSLIGAAFTVAASIGAIEWQSRRTDRERRRFVRDTIGVTLTSLEAMDAGSPSELERATGRPLTWHANTIDSGFRWLGRIMEWQPPDDLPTLRAYDVIQQVTDGMRSEFAKEAHNAQLRINEPMGSVARAAIPMRENLTVAQALLT